MRFPPSFIDRLKNHFLISEVIGKRIAIKRHGREYQALCPFHNEKSPSFTINDEKGFYHCFGCGAHGDAISFVMQHDRASYPEAIETLARDAGIALPEISPEQIKKAQTEKTLYDVIEAACTWFEKQLQSPAHVLAWEYAKQRGIHTDLMRQFRIGYAPDERTALNKHLLQLGFDVKLQIDAGLVIPTDDGQIYDRFRGRLMFPIRSSSGKVIAFGGRLLASSSKNLPKYLNSPETALFKKGEMLFNLDQAKKPARETGMVAVMEGYMDVVMTAQSGIPYAVATLGTAVTPSHLRLLWQLSKEPVMCLDGDTAGKRAMLRAIEVALPLLSAGQSLRFAVLPKGEDPDSYVQKYGKASFETLLQNAKRLSQVIWESLAAQHKITQPESRAALEGAFTKLCASITDNGLKNHYLSYFKKQLWESSRTQKTGKPASSRSTHVEQMAVQHFSAVADTLIRRMLKTLILFPALLGKSQVEELLARLDIRSAPLDAMRNVLLASITDPEAERADSLAVYVESKLEASWVRSLLSDSLKLPYTTTLSIDDALALWNETAEAYQLSHLELELQELQERLGDGIQEADYMRLIELKQSIDKARRNLTFAAADSDAI
ncbi:MAG: DNA primase [Rickettsiales bacterium]|jgi:DNA primase|nr:DNA primase [Rickettsiales bacterium]